VSTAATDDRADEPRAAAFGSEDSSATPRPLDPLIANLAEVQEYFNNYVSAQKDALIAAGRRALLIAVAAVLALVLAMAAVGAATVLLLEGLAHAIADSAGGRIWIGEIAIGAGLVLVIAAALACVAVFWLRKTTKATKRQYERRHQEQRARFGYDVAERAAQTTR
jgi:hypothetical protein